MALSPKDLLAIGRDVTGTAGLGAITYGAYQIYPPAGFITGGLFAVIAVVLLSIVEQAKKARG